MKSRYYTELRKKVGLIPGALVHIGDKKAEKVKITIFDYEEGNYIEKEAKNIEECFQFRDKTSVTWINIDGLHEIDIIERLGANFKFHPLMLEDILNTNQRPKYEDFDSYIFLVVKMLKFIDKSINIDSEQVSIILGNNFVLSFQEYEGDVFNSIRERIRNSKGRIRKMGADYLAYLLLDAIIDNYFVLLEKFGERIEKIEDNLVNNPNSDILKKIHKQKSSMLILRKAIWPLRELINNLIREESSLFSKETGIFLRDIYDHTIRVIETIESYKEMISGMLEIYLSSISNKMNQVMKILTIFAVIFIPLTFMAGIYGMNFRFFPELKWKWAYPCWWLFIIVIVVGMLIYFKKKKWI